MTSSLGLDGRFWPCNEDLHWRWFSLHGVSKVYVVACYNVSFSLVIILYCSFIILTTGIRAMVCLGYARWCFYVESNCGVHVRWYPTP